MTGRTIRQFDVMKSSCCLIGAGVIGAEYACTFNALGTEVDLVDGRGLILVAEVEKMTGVVNRLIEDNEFARQQSLGAREQMVELYSFANTYGRMATELNQAIDEFRASVPVVGSRR